MSMEPTEQRGWHSPSREHSAAPAPRPSDGSDRPSDGPLAQVFRYRPFLEHAAAVGPAKGPTVRQESTTSHLRTEYLDARGRTVRQRATGPLSAFRAAISSSVV